MKPAVRAIEKVVSIDLQGLALRAPHDPTSETCRTMQICPVGYGPKQAQSTIKRKNGGKRYLIKRSNYLFFSSTASLLKVILKG
jgi:hypothetical protein